MKATGQLNLVGMRRACDYHRVYMHDCGECRKRDGQSTVEAHNEDWMDWIRREALRYWMEFGSVTSDDLRAIADKHGRQPGHENAWGCVFRGSGWKKHGYRKSRRPAAHARMIAIWKREGAK